VVIEVPVPDADPSEAGPVPARDRGFLAAVLPEEKSEASESADSARQRTPEGELDRARRKLLKLSSVAATIVETVTVADRSFKAEGRYLQTGLKPSDWRLRLELVVKIGETEGSLLEVCDGGVLWTRTEIEFSKKKDRKDRKETTVTRRDVGQIMSAARKSTDEKMQSELIASLGLGGLPALIAAVEKDMKFAPVVKEETLRDRPVYAIQGTWTNEYTAKLRESGRGAQSLLLALLPDSLRLSIDRETGVPLRILYLKKVPGREVSRPMLTLDLLNVELDQPINSSEFNYEPPADVTPIEQTKIFVDMLTATGAQPQKPSR
jgi:outer membrane lipoprotein-sorting protein